MKILITGGAGTLGSALTEHWLPHGHTIIVIDNYSTGNAANLPEHPNLSLYEGSVSDLSLLESLFSKYSPDLVIHSAASYKDPDDWIEDVSTNVIGTVNIVKLCNQFNVKRLINFQTALTYGTPDTVPIPDNHPSNPITSYGITKTAGESFLKLSEVPTLSLRLANITGPRLSIGPIPTFYQRIKASKSCFCTKSTRDFLDQRDFLNFMDIAIDISAPTGIFNLSTGEKKSIHEIYLSVCSYLDVLPDPSIPIVDPNADDVADVVLDPSRTMKSFNWSPKYSFDQTITYMLNWYDTFGITSVFSHLKSAN